NIDINNIFIFITLLLGFLMTNPSIPYLLLFYVQKIKHLNIRGKDKNNLPISKFANSLISQKNLLQPPPLYLRYRKDILTAKDKRKITEV
ncbi:hypothetical protein, partial [Capnocytophaga leadbetteri]|uniref:hypothetical protein n=1 Tax=Capnocytophaga leadbetteri TaxID=327575 RepID=UPI0026EDD328